MFFQSIYQMMSAGTDLNINIRRVNNNLTVAVMPKRSTLKDEAQQLIVPLILNGTPVELDGQFLQAVTTPLQKVQGLLTNLETFENQAKQAEAQSKPAKSANEKESKEATEKREKMEKLLKRAEEGFTAGRYSEATTYFKQAKVFADATKQQEIEARMQAVQKKASEGSLFAEQAPQTPQPVIQQPSVPVMQQPAGGQQQQMFMEQSVQQPMPQPTIQQPAQPIPQPQIVQPQPAPQTYQPEIPQPMYGQYYQNAGNTIPGQPMGQQPVPQPQMYIQQPGGYPQQPQQWQQPQQMQQQTPVMQAMGNNGKEYQSQPQPTETVSFDKDNESDRELLREDPYAEYLDFPEECRIKDEAQMELVYC